MLSMTNNMSGIDLSPFQGFSCFDIFRHRAMPCAESQRPKAYRNISPKCASDDPVKYSVKINLGNHENNEHE
jgi:hypothetical protein